MIRWATGRNTCIYLIKHVCIQKCSLMALISKPFISFRWKQLQIPLLLLLHGMHIIMMLYEERTAYYRRVLYSAKVKNKGRLHDPKPMVSPRVSSEHQPVKSQKWGFYTSPRPFPHLLLSPIHRHGQRVALFNQHQSLEGKIPQLSPYWKLN